MRRRIKSLFSAVLSLAVVLSCFAVNAYASETATIVSPPTHTVFYEGINWVNGPDGISIIGSIDPSGTVLSYKSKEYKFSKSMFGANMAINPVSGKWKAGKNDVKIDCDDLPSGVYAYTNIYFASVSAISIEKKPNKINLLVNKDWKLGYLGDVEITSFDMTGTILSVSYDNSEKKSVSYPDNQRIGWSVDPEVELFYPGKSNLFATFCGFSAPFNVYYLKEMLGDVNGDSLVNSYDALIVLKSSTGMITLDSTQKSKADIDKNGKINSADALSILKFIVGQSETLYNG